ncbi:MAG: shikimate kinase [Candidatus Margulisiibacteriota bacterium]
MNIILIGFMGSGKSSVGKALAKRLNIEFLDTDELIEGVEGKKISRIFKEEGEDHFRALETDTLKTLKSYKGFVLSAGGGIVLRQENIDLLKEIGKVVLLTAEPDKIHERVGRETHRPLLNVSDPRAEIARLLEKRRPSYQAAADLTIDTTTLSVTEVAEKIIKELKL